MNINGGIVLTDHQKKIIKTGNEYQRLGALMQGLKQNVGHLNEEMAKTPLGKQMALNNQITNHLTKLGQHTIFAKNAFTELKLAIMPFSASVVRIFSAAIGIIAKFTSGIVNAVNWLFINTEKTTKGMKLLKLAIIGVVGTLAVMFAPITIIIGKIALIGLLIEDLWVAFHGGESVIGSVFALMKEKFPGVFKVIESAWEITKSIFNAFERKLTKLIEGIAAAFNSGDDVIHSILNVLIYIHAIIWNHLKSILNRIGEKWNGFLGGLKSSMFNLGSSIKEMFLGVSDNIQSLWEYLKSKPEQLKNDWYNFIENLKSSMFNLGSSIKEMFLGVFQSIGDYFDDIINSVLEKIETVKAWGKDLFSFGDDDEKKELMVYPQLATPTIMDFTNPNGLFNNTNLSDTNLLTSTSNNLNSNNRNNNFNVQNGAIQLNITTSKEINKDTLVDFSMDAFNTAIKQSITSYEGGFDD